MTPEEKERLEACVQEISSILYKNTPSDQIETLEGIEITVRQQTLAEISPKIARLGARSLAPDGDAGVDRGDFSGLIFCFPQLMAVC